MVIPPLLGLFGGTFDPIHNGHLQVAKALVSELDFAQLIFLPNNIPPHRPQPKATAQQRLAMIKLAISNTPVFAVEDWELQRDTPSYTVDTLKITRQKLGMTRPLAFIIGADSLCTLTSWYQWQSLTDYAHIVICPRPDYTRPDDKQLNIWLAQRECNDKQQLHQQPAGLCYFAHTPMLPISATQIRLQHQENHLDTALLPHKILDYIQKYKLYSK